MKMNADSGIIYQATPKSERPPSTLLREVFGVSYVQSRIMKAVALLLAWMMLASTGKGNEVQIVPLPVKAHMAGGAAYRVAPSTVIVCEGNATEIKAVADRAIEAFRRVTGWSLKTNPASDIEGCIVLRLDQGLFPDLPDWQRDESYRLSVTAARVEVSARTSHGLFNGVQTLVQLVAQSKAGQQQIPACGIEDYPRFQWRGLLLDPARHFLPLEFLKKFVDVMAFYKYNRLQLHLTDDQGWRLEIKKYPGLTQIGSVRKESPRHGDRNQGDGAVYGPFFYTQLQIHELVTYAQARHVTIVPEIEIPGHFRAALAAHPEFSCTGGPFEVRTRWGVDPDILCPGNDDAVAFAKDVLGEVCERFPSQLIHIGGDEVPRDRWKVCPKCQARMKAEGLKNEAELQTWLNHQLEKFLASKGRRMIGWDEILEGGLTPGAVVMSWRGNQGGLAAAQAGHDVVMSPTSHCYFDFPQAKGSAEPESIGGFIPLDTVYSFEPVPATLAESQQRHILGGQGNLWGECFWSGKDVEYFAFPRALALAEILWSPAEGRSLASFLSRLDGQLAHLDRMRVNYRKPDDTKPAGQPTQAKDQAR